MRKDRRTVRGNAIGSNGCAGYVEYRHQIPQIVAVAAIVSMLGLTAAIASRNSALHRFWIL